MITRYGRQLLCAVSFLGVTAAAYAQEAQVPGAALKETIKPIEQAASADALEPAALDALKGMSAYLATLKDFTVKSQFEAELVLDTDQKVSVGGSTDYQVRRPDGLKATLTGDLGSREFVYDGKLLTVVDPNEKVYAQVDVEPTIKQMLEQVAYHLNVELPLADMFDAGTGDALETQITEGFFVSEAPVGGVPAKHWAYRTDDKDFEIWIADGAEPYPLRLVIDDDTAPARPRFEANLTWTKADSIADATFAFTPPAGFDEITFLVTTPQTAELTK